MTENRRITDKLPGEPLQWEEASAAPAAGQARLATELQKDIDSIADELEGAAAPYGGDFADTVNGCVEALRQIASRAGAAPTIGCGGSGKCGVGDLPCLGCDNCPEFAAPVAADTEQATIDTPELRELIGDVYRAGSYSESIEKSENALIRYLATPADAGAGLTDDRIAELFDESGNSAGMIGRYIRFARAVEREVLARMSSGGERE